MCCSVYSCFLEKKLEQRTTVFLVHLAATNFNVSCVMLWKYTFIVVVHDSSVALKLLENPSLSTLEALR